jgi:hypothetical protein
VGAAASADGNINELLNIDTGQHALVTMGPDSDITINGDACSALRFTGGDATTRNYHCVADTTTTTTPPDTTTTTDPSGSTTTTTTPGTDGTLPGPDNTGPVGTLTPVSAAAANAILAQDNGVLQNASVTGCLTVTGDNVSILNSRIGCDSPSDYEHPVVGEPYPPPNGTLTIDHSELYGTNPAQGSQCSASLVGYQHYVLTNSNLHDCGDGIEATSRGAVIRDNYIHDLFFYDNGNGDYEHSDGIQSFGSEDPSDTVIIDHNTILVGAGQGGVSGIMFGEEFGVLPLATVTDNYISDAHGSYTIYTGWSCADYMGNFCVSGRRITITGNQIGPASYGIWHVADPSLLAHTCNVDLKGNNIDSC